MNVEGVKRIVTLNRHKAQYQAAVKSGLLSQSEADLIIAMVDQEIVAIRAQENLQLSGASPAPSKGAKGG